MQRVGLGGAVSSDVELRNLRDANDDLERQISNLHKEMREKEQQLAEERKISEQVSCRKINTPSHLRVPLDI